MKPPPTIFRLAALLGATLLFGSACSSDCDTVESEIGLVCVPDALGADRPSILEVREACGTNCSSGPSCTAILVDGAVQLTLREDHCNIGTAACDGSACEQLVVPCTLPALAAGTYPILLRGGPSQILRVTADGVSACRLPVPPPPP